MAELELLTVKNGVTEPEVELTDATIPEAMAKEYQHSKGDEE